MYKKNNSVASFECTRLHKSDLCYTLYPRINYGVHDCAKVGERIKLFVRISQVRIAIVHNANTSQRFG